MLTSRESAKKDRLAILAKKLLVAGDPSRMQILCLLFGGEKICVSEIAEHTKSSIAVISHHLQALAKEEIVVCERSGKRMCYSVVKSPIINDLKKLICKYT